MRLLLFVCCVLLSGVAKAQFAGGDICNHLISTGRVSLIQDTRLTELLGSQPKTYYANPEQQEKAGAKKVMGFRIRVFSGNQQSKSKIRAYFLSKHQVRPIQSRGPTG